MNKPKTLQLKKGSILRDCHPARRSRKIVVEQIGSDGSCRVKNTKTGRTTFIKKHNLTDTSKFAVSN